MRKIHLVLRLFFEAGAVHSSHCPQHPSVTGDGRRLHPSC